MTMTDEQMSNAVLPVLFDRLLTVVDVEQVLRVRRPFTRSECVDERRLSARAPRVTEDIPQLIVATKSIFLLMKLTDSDLTLLNGHNEEHVDTGFLTTDIQISSHDKSHRL